MSTTLNIATAGSTEESSLTITHSPLYPNHIQLGIFIPDNAFEFLSDWLNNNGIISLVTELTNHRTEYEVRQLSPNQIALVNHTTNHEITRLNKQGITEALVERLFAENRQLKARVSALESINSGTRIGNLEGVNSATRIGALEHTLSSIFDSQSGCLTRALKIGQWLVQVEHPANALVFRYMHPS